MEQKQTNIANPPNSEVSEQFLLNCARAPAAVGDMQLALQKDEHGNYQKIRYNEVHDSFNLFDLVSYTHS